MNKLCEYEHIQKGIVRPILLISAVFFLVIAIATWKTPPLMPVFLAAVMASVLLAFSFSTLTIRDEDDHLAVCFGPIPFFKKHIPYSEMTAVEQTRSTLLAGWGIHWTLRGWLWNIGGFDCVRIETGGTGILIGTDDPDGLAAFLLRKIDRRSDVIGDNE